MDLNSEKYWETRFQTDWKSRHGVEQTVLHYETIVEHLPEYIIESIRQNSYTICDMGCGLGEGVVELQKTFSSSTVFGIDFSQTAVDEANEKYGSENRKFIKGDILNNDKYFDVIVLSHVIEHFKNPFEILKSLSHYSKYLIVAVPFREKNMCDEHEFRFVYSSFPLKIDNKSLMFFKEIPPMFFEAGNYTVQEQMLVVYANEDLSEGHTLANFNSYYDEKLELDATIKKLKRSESKLKKTNSKLKKENNHFKSTKAYKFWQFYSNLKKKFF